VKRCLFFFLIFLIKYAFSGENPYIRHYGISEGLLTNTIYHISQDKEGFLWFSTDAGVVKYNGTVFQNFRKRDGLTDKEILKTQEDSRGRIWMFSFNGNIQFYYNNKIHNHVNTGYLKEIDSREFIIGFYEDRDSVLFFYTSHGRIYGLDSDNSVTKWNYPSLGRLYYITSNADGEILFVTQSGLYLSDGFDQNPVLFRPLEILNVFSADDPNYLVLNQSGELLKFKNEKQLTSTNNPLPTQKLITAFTDSSGLIWIGTFDQGVFCIRDDQVLFNLPISQSQMIFPDRAGNIWITSMNEGIYKIQPGFASARHFPTPGLDGKGIYALYPKGSGDVWFSNGNSVYYYCKGEIHPFIDVRDTLFIDILAEFENELLFGKRNDAIYATEIKKDNHVTDNIPVKPGKQRLFNLFIKGFAINKEKTEICIQHINNLFFYRSDNPTISTIAKINERVYSIYYNRNSQLLINTNDAISIKLKDTIQPCEELKPFFGKRIDGHVVIDKNSEVYNIEGDSLWIISGVKLMNLTKQLEFSPNHPIVKLLYHEPYLYFTTRNQIYRTHISENKKEDTKADIQVIEIQFSSIRDVLFQNDTLFIASKEGLTLISPDEFNKFRQDVPSPYFTNIQSKERKLYFTEGKEIILRGNTNLHIDFDAINFTESQTNYSYKLEGLEKNWNMGPETSVVYKNLSPQNYTFKLRAGSFGTDWSKAVELIIIIKPAFYQRTIFIIACLIFIIFIIFFISRLYIRWLKKSQEVAAKLITYEQRALQSMMNPHFIFNSLGSIQNYLLQNKANEASLYLSQFARLIRQNLNSANTPFISIEDETDRLMNYLSLEKLRLDDKFEFRIEVDPDLHSDEVVIPSLVIQPFVENAVWHGISPMNQRGQINISIRMETEKSLVVSVEDNGIGMKQSQQYFTKADHISIGMETTQKRLNLICKLHKLQFEIQFSEVHPGNANPGTRVSFIIPYRYNSDIS
jgi:outer membrane protein assembly factor BamB